MIALFYNYADFEGDGARELMGIFDRVEDIPNEYRREEWNDSDNRIYWKNGEIIEPWIKSYGGKRFYRPNESKEAKKMFKTVGWDKAFGFYSAHEISMNKIIKL